MEQVKEMPPTAADTSLDLDLWLAQKASQHPALNLARLREVCELAEQAEAKALASGSVWAEGRSSYQTGMQMADILWELQIDEDALVAAIIYRAVRENQLTLNHVRNQFGETVAQLVEGVLKMVAISEIKFGQQARVLGESTDRREQARRMLVTLVDDVRVALLKLAERICVIRAGVKRPSKKNLSVAREVFEIYAPLAHRLGIGHLKWELEDLSFRLLEPLSYKRIARLLDEKRTDRQDYIAQVVADLEGAMQLIGIEAKVSGRPKHIYSIWRKMKQKGIPFSEVYDVRAVRVLVDQADDCYRALGTVHSLWRSVPQEFDDYIANPKENGYQSLHTAVIGPEGKVLEVQIRSQAMHDEAEFGVCAHWQYKAPADSGQELQNPEQYEQRLEWLRQLLESQDEDQELAGLDLTEDISIDRVYVFTPEGDLVDMMPGATPVDFAYRIHTEVGHQCRGAKINGRVVPLNTRLSSGDRIEIIQASEPAPLREWLHEHLGYVTTARARGKIQAWFAKRERQKNIEEGKKVLLDELTHLGIESIDILPLAEQCGYENLDEFFCDLAVGRLQVIDLVEDAAGLEQLGTAQLDLGMDRGRGQDEPGSDARGEDEILVSGQGELDFEIASCCQPVPGDLIVGVIDDQVDGQDRVAVHRQDCLQALRGDVLGSKIKLEWQEGVRKTFPVSVEVTAWDRRGLLHDITGVFMADETNVLTINTQTDKQSNRVNLKMTIEVPQLNRLLQTLDKIEQLPNVMKARRAIGAHNES